jgi:hypothetical protein
MRKIILALVLIAAAGTAVALSLSPSHAGCTRTYIGGGQSVTNCYWDQGPGSFPVSGPASRWSSCG